MQILHTTRPRGFSLVELMVAMLIGLIGTIIIFQVFEVSEGIKRTTTSGGDAQQNGVVATYVIERDLRQAGNGFSDASLIGCTVLANDSARATPAFTLTLAPVVITPGATAKVPDTLTIFYGSANQAGNGTKLTQAIPAPGTANLSVKDVYGFSPGDLIVLLEPASGNNCSLMEVNQVGTPGASNVLVHDTNGYAGHAPRFNPGVAGLGVGYGVDTNVVTDKTTRVYNLGNLYTLGPGADPTKINTALGLAQAAIVPVHNTYAIDANNSLNVTSAFVIDPATRAPLVSALADNIVQLQAQYGLDDGNVDVASVPFNTVAGKAGDGLIDRYVSATAFNAIAPRPWPAVIALRIAVVARSALPEKPRGSDGLKCDATTDGSESIAGVDQRPSWRNGTVIDVSGSGDPDPASLTNWKCYRYRVFESTIPLRNWIWRSS